MKHFGFARIVRMVFLLVLALSVTAAMSAQSTPKKKTTQKKSTTTKTTTQADPGQRAFIDPVTHKPYQPSPDEVQALNAAGKKMKKAAAQPKMLSAPNMRGMEVPEDSMAYAVATKSPDGKIGFACVDGKTKADKLVESGTVIQTKKEVPDEK